MGGGDSPSSLPQNDATDLIQHHSFYARTRERAYAHHNAYVHSQISLVKVWMEENLKKDKIEKECLHKCEARSVRTALRQEIPALSCLSGLSSLNFSLIRGREE